MNTQLLHTTSIEVYAFVGPVKKTDVAVIKVETFVFHIPS